MNRFFTITGFILVFIFFPNLLVVHAKSFSKVSLTSEVPDSTSLFDHLHGLEKVPSIKISTDVGFLFRTHMREEYQPAKVEIKDGDGNTVIGTAAKIRTRGNMRKQVCGVPPVKIDFESTDLATAGFLDLDDLKFVFPCGKGKADQMRMYKEYLVYQLYDVISDHGMRVILIDVIFEEDSNIKQDFTGMIVEDEEEYARRKNAIIIESGKITDGGLDREAFLKMTFFQYMIANTDWIVPTKHNLEMVKIPEVAKVLAVPYDFDYCGLVGHHYAVPNDQLPIKSVHQRYYFPYKITDEEFDQMVEYYKSIEGEIIEVIKNAAYLDQKAVEECEAYVGAFFQLLDNTKKLRRSIVK